MTSQTHETIVEKRVTYAVQLDEGFVVNENVPARVCLETGEQFFSPQTVERIHEIIRGKNKPTRTIATPVYEFAA